MGYQSNITSDGVIPEQSALLIAFEAIEQHLNSGVSETPPTADIQNEPLLENPSEPEGGQIESNTHILQPEDVDLPKEKLEDKDLPTDYKSVLTLFV